MIWRSHSLQLHKIPAFQHLPDRVLQDMADAACAHTLKAGDVLLHQGDTLESFFAVQSGALSLINYTPEGDSVALKIYGAGDVFGLLAISGAYPHPTQIEALHDSMLISINGQDVRRLITRSPELALILIDLLTQHVREGHARVRSMANKRVERRLAQFLLTLCQKFGKPYGTGILIDIPITQRDLAGFVNTTVETINRTLTVWCKQDILLCSHKRIEVLDFAALETIAENMALEHV